MPVCIVPIRPLDIDALKGNGREGGGPLRTVPELLFEKKRLITSIQQLLTSHI